MAGLFDKNVNATETHITTVSEFDATTGEHIATYEVRIFEGTGIPGFSTLTLADDAEPGHAVCWTGSQWQQVIDLRGTAAYEKESAKAVAVKILGPLSDELTSAEPATEYDTWNGSEWITDTAAHHAADVAAADLRAQQLVDAAMASINVIQLKLRAGRTLTSTETTKLNTILDYIDAVKAVDTSIVLDIDWPTQPVV